LRLVEKLGGVEVAVVVVSLCANVCNVRPNACAAWPRQTFREDSGVQDPRAIVALGQAGCTIANVELRR
jgi:hypothetical protein